MAKLEYRVCVVRGDAPGPVEDDLNSKLKTLSEEGWRFVETIYAQNSVPLLLFKKQAKAKVKLKREKPASGSEGKPSNRLSRAAGDIGA